MNKATRIDRLYETNLFDMAIMWIKAACVLAVGCVLLLVGWHALCHMRGLHANCAAQYDKQVEFNLHLLEGTCRDPRFAQELACVAASEALKNDREHWMAECSMHGLAEHVPGVNPLAGVLVFREIGDASYRFVVAFAAIAGIYVYLFRRCVTRPVDTTRDFYEAGRMSLPTTNCAKKID